MVKNKNGALLQYQMKLAMLNTDYLNIDSIFSDETKNFVSNPEPESGERVEISIRVFKDNIDEAGIYITGSDDFFAAKKIRSEGLFDYYGVSLVVEKKISYYFAVIKNGQSYFYNKRGLFRDVDNSFDFTLIPGFKTPDWAKGAVMYQIFIDRFYNGDKSNDVVNYEYTYLGKVAKRISDWNSPVEAGDEDICNFYGGDLQGIIDKMGYLKGLGVEAIFLNPVFVSPSSHKYDTQDYDYIDPHFGRIVKDGGSPLTFDKFHNKFADKYKLRTTDIENLEASNRLMADLIKIAHEHGIKVILDGVFNHCGAFHKWLDRENFYGSSGYPEGAYRSKDSLYHNYFRWFDEAWPNNECYDSYWNFENHPKLYFEGSKELYDYILNIGRKWVSPPFNADGWRLDVASYLGYTKEFNIDFWRDFRKAVKQANPDAVILAEHYGDPSDWLDGGAWDTIMNYDAFMEPMTWFFTGLEKHSEEFRGYMLNNAMAFENTMRRCSSKLSFQSQLTAMNQISNHDHSRFLTRTNMSVGRLHTVGAESAGNGINKSIMMEAVVMLMTWPGSPTIYYGDEAGVCGWTDPDNRRTYPWGNEDKMLLDFHHTIIQIRHEHEALRYGSLEYLHMNYGIISYARWYKNDIVICVFNNNDRKTDILIPVWKANLASGAILRKLISTNGHLKSYDLTPKEYIAEDGFLALTLPPHSSCVFAKK